MIPEITVNELKQLVLALSEHLTPPFSRRDCRILRLFYERSGSSSTKNLMIQDRGGHSKAYERLNNR